MEFDGNTTGTASYLQSGIGARDMSKSPGGSTMGGNYGRMPTRNLKFEKFIELMFQSGMEPATI